MDDGLSTLVSVSFLLTIFLDQARQRGATERLAFTGRSIC